MVLDLAELELQLEFYVVIHIAPSLTSMRYSLAQNATMTKVHLCSKMTPVDSCGIFLLLDICFVVLLSLLYLPTSLCPDTMPDLSKFCYQNTVFIYIYIFL